MTVKMMMTVKRSMITVGSIDRSSWHERPLLHLTDLTDLTSQSCMISSEELNMALQNLLTGSLLRAVF